MMKERAKELVARLQLQGYEAYFAGGSVRDMLLKRTPKDFDIVTSAKPDEIENIMNAAGFKTIPTGKQFGIITVIADETQYEIATFRADGSYSDGRRPDEIRFVTSLKEDAARRDFTINAMFYDPITGSIFDYFDGQKDLEKGVIRFVGSARERIHEDKLRILRAIRFAGRYGFRLDATTFDMDGYLLKQVSRERIGAEFREILIQRHGLTLLGMYDLVRYIIPGIEALWGLAGEQDPTYHAEGNVWVHTQMVVDELRNFEPHNFELLLAGLLHDIGKPATQCCSSNGRVSNIAHADVGARMAQNICSHWLRLGKEQTDFVTELVKQHMRMHEVQKMNKQTLFKLFEHPYIDHMMLLQHADAVGRETTKDKGSNLDFMREKKTEFQNKSAHQRPGCKSLVTGELLIKHGFLPGPSFKVILEAARGAQLEGKIGESDAEEWVKQNAKCYYVGPTSVAVSPTSAASTVAI